MPGRVLVAGAGIGGLTAALALLRSGIDVEVYEQAPELKEVGAGVQLAANGTRALYALGVGEALAALSCEATGKEVRLWSSGETWKLFDLGAVSIERYGFPYLTVYRPDLLDVLAKAVEREKPGAIHLGSKVVGFQQDSVRAELQLENRNYVEGDALIGADGVHSRVRQGLFGEDAPKFSGVMVWRGIIPMERLPARMTRLVGTNWVGPGAHVVHYPLRSGTLMNFVGALERDWRVESWNTRGTNEEMAADFAGWHEDVQLMIGAIETPFKWALMVRPPMARWTVGRVTLLGDACHPMVPFLAQGANMAIEDGFVLARCLSRHGIPGGLAYYERARLDRTRKAVEGSSANIGRFHNPKLADPVEAKRYVDTEWAEARVAERYEWLFRYDVTQVPV
jgi:salicylate hydroxylase